MNNFKLWHAILIIFAIFIMQSLFILVNAIGENQKMILTVDNEIHILNKQIDILQQEIEILADIDLSVPEMTDDANVY